MDSFAWRVTYATISREPLLISGEHRRATETLEDLPAEVTATYAGAWRKRTGRPRMPGGAPETGTHSSACRSTPGIDGAH